MSLENTRYIDLTFINDSDEIKKQIRNTILFLYLAEKHGVSVLSDYLEGTQYGFTASAKGEGSIKLLRITDITEGKVNWDSVPYCDCDKPTKYLLKQDDILVARTGGTTGKSFIVKDVPSNVVYASYLIRLRLKKESNPEFVSSFFNSYTYWSQLVELKRGAAQPNVNAEKLKKIIIPKCSPEVQDKYVSYLNGGFNEDILDTRINEILSLFDGNQELKAEHTYQLDLLKILRLQILQDAVQGKLVLQDPNDEPARKFLDRIKAEKEKLISEKKIKKDKSLPEIKPEEIPFEIPENWEWCRLSNVGIITGGGTPSMANPKFWDGNIPWISPKDMIGDYVKDSEMKVTQLGIDNSSAKLIPKGSLIIVGRSGILKRKLPIAINEMVCTVNQDMKVLIPYVTIMNRYLQLMLFGLENHVLRDFVKFGMTVHSLKYDEFAGMPIPIPPMREQHRIVTKIEQLMNLCHELEQSIQQNQKYTQELLQVALKEALEPKPN